MEETFLNNFRAQFEETAPEEITMETNFKQLDEWDSMLALSLIAMADDEYQVRLSGEHIRSSTLVRDLFDVVNAAAK